MSDRRLPCGVVIVVLVLVAAGVLAFIFWRIETWPARTAERVSQAFSEVAGLRPKITVKDRVFFEQTASVLELAVLSRRTQVERETEHEWLGSKKRIKLRGVYLVKAGFDLTQPFSVKVDENRIRTELPPPRILSVDQVEVEVMAFENGVWNRISPSDIESEIRALPVLARQKASEGGVHNEAFEIFKARLQEKFAPQYEVEAKVRSSPLPEPAPPPQL